MVNQNDILNQMSNLEKRRVIAEQMQFTASACIYAGLLSHEYAKGKQITNREFRDLAGMSKTAAAYLLESFGLVKIQSGVSDGDQ